MREQTGFGLIIGMTELKKRIGGRRVTVFKRAKRELG